MVESVAVVGAGRVGSAPLPLKRPDLEPIYRALAEATAT